MAANDSVCYMEVDQSLDLIVEDQAKESFVDQTQLLQITKEIIAPSLNASVASEYESFQNATGTDIMGTPNETLEMIDIGNEQQKDIFLNVTSNLDSSKSSHEEAISSTNADSGLNTTVDFPVPETIKTDIENSTEEQTVAQNYSTESKETEHSSENINKINDKVLIDDNAPISTTNESFSTDLNSASLEKIEKSTEKFETNNESNKTLDETSIIEKSIFETENREVIEIKLKPITFSDMLSLIKSKELEETVNKTVENDDLQELIPTEFDEMMEDNFGNEKSVPKLINESLLKDNSNKSITELSSEKKENSFTVLNSEILTEESLKVAPETNCTNLSSESKTEDPCEIPLPDHVGELSPGKVLKETIEISSQDLKTTLNNDEIEENIDHLELPEIASETVTNELISDNNVVEEPEKPSLPLNTTIDVIETTEMDLSPRDDSISSEESIKSQITPTKSTSNPILVDDPFKMPQTKPQRLSLKKSSPDCNNNKNNLMKNEVFFSSKDFDFLLSKQDDPAKAFQKAAKDSVLLRFDPLCNQPVEVGESLLLHESSRNVVGCQLLIEEEKENFDDNSQQPLSEDSLLQVFGIGSQPEKARQAEAGPGEECPVSKLVDVTMSLDYSTHHHLNNDDDVIQTTSPGKMAENGAEDHVQNGIGETKILNETNSSEDGRKVKELEEREEILLKRITEKDKQIQKMNHIIEEYEKSIAGFLSEKALIKETYEKKCQQLETERDANYQHLSSLESTFSDLHMKYEKSKQLIDNLKKSEEALMADKKLSAEQTRLQEQRYDTLKSHAMQQMERANQQLKSDSDRFAQESQRLKALLKKEEITRISLQEQLQHKTRECEELIKIWDELKADPR